MQIYNLIGCFGTYIDKVRHVLYMLFFKWANIIPLMLPVEWLMQAIGKYLVTISLYIAVVERVISGD